MEILIGKNKSKKKKKEKKKENWVEYKFKNIRPFYIVQKNESESGPKSYKSVEIKEGDKFYLKDNGNGGEIKKEKNGETFTVSDKQVSFLNHNISKT